MAAPFSLAAANTAKGKVDGGVTAAEGFEAAGVHCGIKKKGLDLALIVASAPVSAAGVFTRNLAVAAPVIVSREHLARSDGRARAIVVNSGCANACTGDGGLDDARQMAETTAKAIGCAPEHVLVASTGVIGVSLDMSKVRQGIGDAAAGRSRANHRAAAEAIMTTDPWLKETAVAVDTSSGTYRIGGTAKGSGMIEPRLATMLAFLTTDAEIDPAMLQRALGEAVSDTFNAITVDGECSTNDTVLMLASGAARQRIDEASYSGFVSALRTVCGELALEIVRGGEGATKLITVHVKGARTQADAELAARTIANSLLVKTAVHGGDPNWGRIVAASGRSGAAFNLSRAIVTVGQTVLFENGRPFDERSRIAADYLKGTEVAIEVDLGMDGSGQATVWTCDLTADYVRINADYRT